MFYPLLRISTKQNEGHLKSNNIQKKFPAIHNTFVVIGDLKNKERNSRIGDFWDKCPQALYQKIAKRWVNKDPGKGEWRENKSSVSYIQLKYWHKKCGFQIRFWKQEKSEPLVHKIEIQR